MGGSCIMPERIHQAKIVTVILDQFGPGQNRCLAFSTFTFKHCQNTKNDQINHFHCILYTLTMILNSMSYMQCILMISYTFVYAKNVVDQHDRGCIWCNLTLNFWHLSRVIYAGTTLFTKAMLYIFPCTDICQVMGKK